MVESMKPKTILYPTLPYTPTQNPKFLKRQHVSPTLEETPKDPQSLNPKALNPKALNPKALDPLLF